MKTGYAHRFGGNTALKGTKGGYTGDGSTSTATFVFPSHPDYYRRHRNRTGSDCRQHEYCSTALRAFTAGQELRPAPENLL